jgi:hypothetical protein
MDRPPLSEHGCRIRWRPRSFLFHLPVQRIVSLVDMWPADSLVCFPYLGRSSWKIQQGPTELVSWIWFWLAMIFHYLSFSIPADLFSTVLK